MATKGKKDQGSTLGRLAGRGEETVSKLLEELGKNPRVTDALGKAMSAKGKLDGASRSALDTIGLAAADELKDMRKQIERLEKRLSRLEGGTRTAGTKRKAASKRTTKKTTTGASKEPPAPSPGRSIGGGAGRGSGGGSAAR